MRMRSTSEPGGKWRWGAVAGVGLLVVWLAWLFGWRSEPASTEARQPMEPQGSAVARSSWDSGSTAAPPEARGTLSIRGRVVGPKGPVPGALVVALASTPPEWLSLLPPDEPVEADWRVGRCDPGPFARRLLELAAERRREEASPLARATTDARGNFQLEGLEQGSFVLWAESGGDVGIQRDVAAGRQDAEVRVAPGYSLDGVVRDVRYEAVAGVRVTALLRELGRFVEATTDARGRFALGPLPWRASTALFSKEGFLPSRLPLDGGGPRRDDGWAVWLSTSQRLSGHVLDERGPVQGATVRLENAVSVPPVITDARGDFAFEGLCAGSYLVTATHEGRQAEQSLGLGKALAPVELVLRAGLQLSGYVTNPRGRPIEGAEVSVSWGSPMRNRMVRTDSRGGFQIGPLVPGTYGMRVRAERYIPREVPPRLLEASEELRIPLKDALLVEGRTEDEAGTSLEGVSLQLMRAEAGAPGDSVATARSGADGVFILDAPESGPWRVVARHPGFVAEALPVSAPSREARVTMRAEASIEVEVVSSMGRAIPNANIRLQHEGAARNDSTNGEGRAVFHDLEPGSYRVKVEPPPWSRSYSSPEEEEVEVRGLEARKVRLRLGDLPPSSESARSRSEVRGRVVYEDGRPVVSFLLDYSPVSHPEGRFSVKLRGSWQQRLTFSEPGLDNRTFRDVVPRDNEVIELGDVVLKEGWTVHGRVLEAGTLAPLAGARVQGVNEPTGPDGSFTVRVIRPGPLGASHPEYQDASVMLAEGQKEVTVMLERGARLEGRVTSAGVPVLSGTVQLRSEQGVLLASTGFWEGRYAMRDVRAGRYLVRAVARSDEGPAPVFPLRQVDLTPGGRTTVDFEPVAGTSVEILVPERNIEVHLIPGNPPLLGPKQGLYSKLGSGLMGRMVREGVRYFPQVPEGHYTLFAMRRDEDFTDVHREELDVPAGGQVRFSLLPLWSRFDD